MNDNTVGGRIVHRSEINGMSLTIDFAPATYKVESVPVNFILDLNAEGKVIGLEILNLKDQGGRNLLLDWPPITQDIPSWSYDPDVDAFYLKLADDRSVDQRVVKGDLLINDQGRLVGLHANLLPET